MKKERIQSSKRRPNPLYNEHRLLTPHTKDPVNIIRLESTLMVYKLMQFYCYDMLNHFIVSETSDHFIGTTLCITL